MAEHSCTGPTLIATGLVDAKKPPNWGAFSSKKSGDVLLSQGATPQVPSALAGLTAVFGMGTGVAPPPWSPETFAPQRLGEGPIEGTSHLDAAGATVWSLLERSIASTNIGSKPSAD